tara:strand:+ start:31106 stop:32026 length:921 start_codon:yes stop_codon:yes gene_type:complete
MSQPTCIEKLIHEFRNRSPMRVPSLISTVFGDVLTQHGGVIWLGSLVKALSPLGVDERLVRTSVFRLVKDGWLKSHKLGRRSYYQLTTYGTREFQRAANRIYNMEKPEWNEKWQLVFPRDIPDDKKEPLRRSLHWQGFRQIAAGVFARPETDQKELLEIIEEFSIESNVFLLNGYADNSTPHLVVQDLVEENWELGKIAKKYKEFIRRFSPPRKWLETHQADPESAFFARTLLIHDYRRILLQDTSLPEKLLPPSWPGLVAQQLTRELYLALSTQSIVHITSSMENDSGPLPKPSDEFYRRFSVKV